MTRLTISRSIAAILICALPIPALARSSDGIVIPERIVLPQPIPASRTTKLSTDPDRDSVLNGAVIGAAVLAAWCSYICGQGLDNGSQHARVVAMSAGVGALLGAQIGAGFTRDRRVLFRWRF